MKSYRNEIPRRHDAARRDARGADQNVGELRVVAGKSVLEQDGVRVIVDESSAEFLAGARVDFQDGLSGKGFAIENPNSTGSCGCGQSFSC